VFSRFIIIIIIIIIIICYLIFSNSYLDLRATKFRIFIIRNSHKSISHSYGMRLFFTVLCFKLAAKLLLFLL